MMEVITGDITKLAVDAIVNAANCTLLGGGGVDGAIHAAAGPELVKACAVFGGCPTGEARITPGFRLPAKYVIHTPGPVWHGGTHNEYELLRSCYANSLRLAAEKACVSIAFPCISTGVYRFPKTAAAEIAVSTVLDWHGEFPRKIIFCCFGETDASIYRDVISRLSAARGD
jgi:O-acetyl-ADP-ribose deacetylase (regulator of RNase III)